MSKLKDKIALITGGGRGIGRGIALAFAEEGAVVTVNYNKSGKQALEVVQRIEEMGGKALAIKADISKVDEVKNMVDTVLDKFGRIDILVNNAGIHNKNTVVDMSVETWDEMILVNLRGVFLCTKFVLPSMLKRGYGKIINIASHLGQKGAGGLVHYSTTKGGVIAFTRALARQVGPNNINVNAIAPGTTLTDLLKPYLPPGGEITKEWLEPRLARLALKRLGKVEDVASTAVFLASEDSNYYAGQTLYPNGGDIMI